MEAYRMKPRPKLTRYRARYLIPDIYGADFPGTLTQWRKKPMGERGVKDWAAKLHDVERGAVTVVSIEQLP